MDIDWIATGTPAPGDLRLLDARRDPESSPDGLCFTADESSSVLWPLPSAVTGPDLVVRTLAEVDGETTVRVVVRPEGETGFERANKDLHTLGPDDTGVLDTVDAPSVSAVRVRGFTPGTHVCVTSVSVGRVVPAG